MVRKGSAVSFCTTKFLVFFLAVFATYWSIPWQRGRVLLLLAASIGFYAVWSRELAVLLCVSIVIDYWLGRAMEASKAPRLRLLLVMISVLGNVGLLCYFKYSNFFLHSLGEAATIFGLQTSLPVLSVILPVGISFYTFEAINYTVDVYRGKIRAERDLTHLMLFVLFFPHLVAGPIVRARAFLPLVARRKHWSWPRAHLGLQLIVLGLVKKLAVADRMALYVDPVFADPSQYAGSVLWLASVAYAVQLYCDFSGYSDIALGLAHLLGFHLAKNFDLPFLAANVSELWRRWHISLSSWIRDYIFIPLGGSREGRLRTYRNLLITFGLCGLWHGAGWNYVVWGLINGILLILHDIFRRWCEFRPRISAALRSEAGTCFRVALTFLCFCVAFVVFRCPELSQAAVMLRGMALLQDGLPMPLTCWGLYVTLAAFALGHVVASRKFGTLVTARVPYPIRDFGMAAAIALAVILAPGTSKAFIYFQF